MKNVIKISISVLLLIIIHSCKTKEIIPIPPVLDVITVSETTINSARLSGAISNVGNQYISDYGFVYSETNATPTLADSKISYGAVTTNYIAPIKFSDMVQGLKINTNYYARSYSTIASGVVYGQTITFKTAEIVQPTVKTDAVIIVFETTTKLRGIIESKGTYEVSEYGICWSSINAIPTTADSKSGKANLSIFPTIYTEDATNLIPNTNYYFRAFVVSNGVTTYGNTLIFKTLAISQPTIKTLEATTTSFNSVKIKGIIQSKGTYEISEYGICWSERFTIPTTDHSKAKIIEKINEFPATFSVNIYSLGAELNYRSYIISNGVTTYGDVLNYKLENSGFPTLSTGDATYISATTHQLQGTIKTRGEYVITEYGICWNYINDFSNTLPLTCISKGSIVNSPTVFPTTFTIDAINLEEKRLYLYRPFAVSNGVTTYGESKSFIFNIKNSN